uniref:Putative secreted protein n=1 Tax=Anopheles darlingi TaxID=43151 RepID=A0A2M4DDS8_ANODA
MLLLLLSGLCKAVRLMLLLLLLFETDFMLGVSARYHHRMLQWPVVWSCNADDCGAGSDFTVRWSIQLR